MPLEGSTGILRIPALYLWMGCLAEMTRQPCTTLDLNTAILREAAPFMIGERTVLAAHAEPGVKVNPLPYALYTRRRRIASVRQLSG